MSNHIDQNRLEVIKRSSDMRHENPWVLASYIPELLDEISLLQEEVLACNQEISFAHKDHQLSRDSAIREAEAAVHAQYAEVLRAADELVVGLGTYALTRVIHRPFEVVLGKAESYRAARANLKGK